MTRRKARSGPVRVKPEDGLPPPPPVRPLEWMTLVRDHHDRPPPVQCRVLDCLALRLDWDERGRHVPGHGFASVAQLAEDAGCRALTVKRATEWAREHGLLDRLRRGHHVSGGTATMSEWRLRRPSQLAPADTLADSQLAPADTLADTPGDSQLAPTDQPKYPQGTHNRDLITVNKASPRTTRTGSRGAPAATDDDDDNPQTSHKPGPRTILDGLPGLDGDDALKTFIIAKLTAAPGVDDPADWLLDEIIGKGEHRVARFIAVSRQRLDQDRARRQADAEADAEYRRQSDGLMQFEREHPEATP
jgi:hypothetical protein